MSTDNYDYQVEMLWDCTQCSNGKRNLGRHKECQNCGNPLDGTEEFYMPGDTSRRAEVKDPNQLNDALTGEDWECRYCKSKQRNNKGECANCTANKSFSTGTERLSDERNPASPPPSRVATPYEYDPERDEIPGGGFGPFDYGRLFKLIGVVVGVGFLIWLLIWALTPKELDAKVSSVYWQHVVHVERNQVMHHESFDVGSEAFNVTDLGTRHHHYDRVLAGHHTEYYSERVKVGEDCHTTPRNCRTVPRTCRKTGCRSNKNGYATCSETCTGGNQVCTGGDRVCRSIMADKRRERQVADYRDVSVRRTFYSWDRWEWIHNRVVSATGHSTADVHWPSEQELAMNDKERGIRNASYTVTFAQDKEQWKYDPKSLDAFQQFPQGSTHHIKVSLGSVTVLSHK